MKPTNDEIAKALEAAIGPNDPEPTLEQHKAHKRHLRDLNDERIEAHQRYQRRQDRFKTHLTNRILRGEHFSDHEIAIMQNQFMLGNDNPRLD